MAVFKYQARFAQRPDHLAGVTGAEGSLGKSFSRFLHDLLHRELIVAIREFGDDRHEIALPVCRLRPMSSEEIIVEFPNNLIKGYGYRFSFLRSTLTPYPLQDYVVAFAAQELDEIRITA